MFFIGDVHGEWNAYRYIINKMQLKGGKKGMDCSLVLGDMGIGFENITYDSVGAKSFIKDISIQHKFIVGNHDDRKLSNTHINCLGDYGYHEKSGIFYLSGGFSVDHKWRKEEYEETGRITWWEEEQLSNEKLEEAFKLYEEVKPSILVAHESPLEIKHLVVTNPMKYEEHTRTETTLQQMVDSHRPDCCIFGHHHDRTEINLDGTEYICLDTLSFGKYADCIFEISGITWD